MKKKNKKYIYISHFSYKKKANRGMLITLCLPRTFFLNTKDPRQTRKNHKNIIVIYKI